MGVWITAFGKEFGNLTQGDDKTKTLGNFSLFVLTHEQIKQIPKERTVTYVCIVADYCPQQLEPNRVHITADGNLIEYLGELTAHTANLTTTKVLWNSALPMQDSWALIFDFFTWVHCWTNLNV